MSNLKPNWSQRMNSFQCKQEDLNRLVLDYLVSEGYQEAAQRFVIEAQLEPWATLDGVEDRLRIRNAVRTGQIQYAMDLAKRLYPKLFETDNYMYFHMQQLRLIELIRERKLEQALSLAQNKSTGLDELKPERVYEMERTLALLAFEKPEESPYGKLMEPMYRQKIAGELNTAILKYEDQVENAEPKMMFLIKLILWAQGALERDGCGDYHRLDLESNDFEEELRRALHGE